MEPGDAEKEAKYQAFSEGYEAALEVLSDEELLDQLEDFIDDFIELGDYKDSLQMAVKCRIKLEELQKSSNRPSAPNQI